MEYIKFRDLDNNQVYLRKDGVDAIMIACPLTQGPTPKTFITCGQTMSLVTPEVAERIIRELDFRFKES